MSKITTEDCKNFLKNHFLKLKVSTELSDWKRTKKFKNEDGLWCRDFSHPVLGTKTILENNGILSIVENIEQTQEIIPIVNPNNNLTFTQKIFSLKEKQSANQILVDFIEQNDNGTFTDDFFETELFKKYSHAMPSQFAFNFPCDSYGNEKSAITNGIDTPMNYGSDYGDEFVICFSDVEDSEPDYYASQSLLTLPKWMGFGDEYHASLSPEAGKLMTVREFFKMMLALGFTYNPTDCLFSDYFKNAQLNTSSKVSNEQLDEFKELEKVENAILKDNVKSLEGYLEKGIQINVNISEGPKLILFAAQNNAVKCFDFLLEKGAGLFIYNDLSNESLVISELLKVTREKNKTQYKQILQKIYSTNFSKLEHSENIINNLSDTLLNDINSKPEFRTFINYLEKNLPTKDFDCFILNNADNVLKAGENKKLDFVLGRCKGQTLVNYIVEAATNFKWTQTQFLLEKAREQGISFSTIKVNGNNIKDYIFKEFENVENLINDENDDEIPFSFINQTHNKSSHKEDNQLSDKQKNMLKIYSYFGGKLKINKNKSKLKL